MGLLLLTLHLFERDIHAFFCSFKKLQICAKLLICTIQPFLIFVLISCIFMFISKSHDCAYDWLHISAFSIHFKS